MTAEITLERQAADGGVVLTVSGVLDLATVPDLRNEGYAAVDEAAADAGAGRTVTFDLAGVRFIDSTGLGALLELRAYALDRGRSLVLVNVPPRVVHVLTLTGLDAVFTLHAQS